MRNYAILGLVLAMFGLLAPSHRLSAQDEIILTLGVPAWREDTFEDPELFRQFEAEHPNVKVVLAPPSDNAFFVAAAFDLEQHLESAADYASSADVLYVSNDNLSIEATLAGYFLDLQPLAAGDPALNPEDFFPSAYESFQWDRGLWGLPVSLNVQIVIYEPAAFDAAGLEYPNAGWTLEDYANADRLLTEFNDAGEMTRPGFPLFGRQGILLRSLLDHGFYDPTTSPEQPRFTDPDTEALLSSWIEYYEEGLFGAAPMSGMVDFASVPLQISSPFLLSSNFGIPGDTPRAGTLLPGGTAALQVEGFAVSSGTQHPELAYELVKYLTSSVQVSNSFFGTSPARRSLVGQTPEGDDNIIIRPEFSPENQALLDQALEGALPTSELRYSFYIDRIVNEVQEGGELAQVLSEIEAEAVQNLQEAASRRGTTVVAVATPVPTPVLAAGEVALDFGLVSFISPLPNRDRWDQVISDFIATDPQVRHIVLDTGFSPSLTDMTEQYDCFYLPFNNTQADDLNTVLSLDPFLDADINFDASDIIGGVMAQVQRDNRTWAYPLNIQPGVLWYNSQMFADADVPAPEDGWTADAFADALRSLRVSPDDPTPFQPREFGGNYLLMLVASFGGLPLDYRTQPVTINFTDPSTVEALRQVLDLAKNGYIAYQEIGNLASGIIMGGGSGGGGSDIPIYNETLNEFSFNRFQFQAETGIEDPYRLTSYPSGSQYTPVTYTVGTAYISASSAAPEACYRWISRLAEHPELFTSMPARRSQLNNPELAAALGLDLSAFYAQYEAQLQAPNVLEFPSLNTGAVSSPGDFITQTWLNRAMDRYVLEDADLETELAEAEMFARDYQTCMEGLPPYNQAMLSSQQEQLSYARGLFNCIESADPSMAEGLPELPEE